jgi:hypothetical protein
MPSPTRDAPAFITQNTSRKVTYTRTVDTTGRAAEAMAKRGDMDLVQVPHTFEVERVAGPRDTNARFRFLVPGQMLVVAEDDLPIIEALIIAMNAERQATEEGDGGVAS